jgi:hypothetical protein
MEEVRYEVIVVPKVVKAITRYLLIPATPLLQDLRIFPSYTGPLSSNSRAAKVKKYLEKKKSRKFKKHIRYECRQSLAVKRTRVNGRFVKCNSRRSTEDDDFPINSTNHIKIMYKLARFFSTANSITVYEAPYFSALNSIQRDFVTEAISILKDKYHAFVPFYLESRLTRVEKRFVVKMELIPQENKLRLISLQLGSLDTHIVPLLIWVGSYSNPQSFWT